MSRLNYYWRILATGFCFFSFSAGGLVLSLTIFPIIYALPVSPEWKRLKSQRIIHNCFRLFVGMMKLLGTLRVEIEGKEKLATTPGQLIIANHPSLIDVVLLISLLPETNCIVKQSLWHNPFIKGVVRSAGYISNATPQGLLDDCSDILTSGQTLIIFPEGTRSVPGKPLKFQRGAAKIALQSQTNITPVNITTTSGALIKGSKWYHVPKDTPVEMTLRVDDPISIQPFTHPDPEQSGLAARRLNHFLQDYFQKEVLSHG